MFSRYLRKIFYLLTSRMNLPIITMLGRPILLEIIALENNFNFYNCMYFSGIVKRKPTSCLTLERDNYCWSKSCPFPGTPSTELRTSARSRSTRSFTISWTRGFCPTLHLCLTTMSSNRTWIFITLCHRFLVS